MKRLIALTLLLLAGCAAELQEATTAKITLVGKQVEGSSEQFYEIKRGEEEWQKSTEVCPGPVGLKIGQQVFIGRRKGGWRILTTVEE